MIPSCLVDEFLGKTYFVPISSNKGDWCVKIQFFEGGTLTIDVTNPNCNNGSFTESLYYSDYKSSSGNKVFFEGKSASDGWRGHFAIREDPNVNDIELGLLKFQSGGKIFEFDMFFSSCTIAPSFMPSIAPTDAPSYGSTCSITQYIGNTYYQAFSGNCYKVELDVGGKVAVDVTDSTCSNSSFTESAVLALYDGPSGNVVNFIPGDLEWSGQLLIKEDSTATEETVQIVSLSNPNKTFLLNLVVPSCS